ncbi:hypothetical protein KEM54_000867 [Ascosphaera aggregata]|nr:hypothetical protein KEM54_000867 [Ascosphaera aggregata]
MQEDNLYRASSQFRKWSFAPTALQAIREKTNAAACERVRAAIRRSREITRTQQQQQQQQQQTLLDSKHGDTPMTGSDVSPGEGDGSEQQQKDDCLTADEELKLVQHYCQMCMSLGDQYDPPLPTMVRATAIQYIRRFYLTNSPMTYHPRSIMPCALFLATKTENYYMSLRHFTALIRNSTEEDIIAPEFLLTQGLRFTFDIKHPFRGLEGATMELTAMARGEGAPAPHHPSQTPSSLQKAIQSLPAATSTDGVTSPIVVRIARSHQSAREILKSAAQFTDAYFLYTPSQIWLASLLLVDRPLAEFYLDTKLGGGSSVQDEGERDLPERHHQIQLLQIREKVDIVLQKCSELLDDYLKTHTPETEDERKKELKNLAKKLHQCQDPEKANLKDLKNKNRAGGIVQSVPRETTTTSSSIFSDRKPGELFSAAGSSSSSFAAAAEHATKRRRLEQDEAVAGKNPSNPFGPEIVKPS